MHPCLLPLDSEHAALPLVGGKGANLARLARAGFPVPAGFLLTTAAYRQYLAAAGLDPRISSILASARLDDPAALEAASSAVRALFTFTALPPDLVTALLAAYRDLGSPPVAVRSSATAEDLPDMSFAGQQDTFLNVQGQDALLRAVVDCWSSLWTGRAIGYRARQDIPSAGLALAVVVQRMVPAAASGVLFTANPLTGLRSETVIDATLGLGEALVSGQVEPDRYLVDALAGRILEKKLGAKAVTAVSRPGGGVDWLPTAGHQRQVQALPDRHILALAELGRRVAGEYGSPQDIEWALEDDRLVLLQARPITSLYPIPAGLDERDLRAMFSFGAVQGMLDPLTPLGQDAITLVGTGFARLYGYTHFDETNLSAVRRAGERLFVDITSLLRNPVGSRVIRFVLRFIEPSTAQALERVSADPRLQPAQRHLKLATALRLLRGVLPLFARLLLALAAPRRRIAAVNRKAQTLLSGYRAASLSLAGSRDQKLAARLASMRAVVPFFRPLAYALVPTVAAAMAMWTLLRRLASSLDRRLGGDGRFSRLAVEVTRGVENNLTTEMDLVLWQTALAIRADARAAALFRDLPAAELAARYTARDLPPAVLSILDSFIDRYGFRGLAEIDLGRPRWVEDPTHIVQVLASYLRIDQADKAPDAVFERGRLAGEQAAGELARAARQAPGGWLKAHLVRFAARRVRILMGVRESPKFYLIAYFAVTRLALLDSGRDYASGGVIDHPEDLFFLTLRELEALARGQPRGWKTLVAERRAVYRRELLRRQVPRLLLSDGRAFYEGLAAPVGSRNALSGDPVSPGLAEGPVRVVLDPRGVSLAPGEILVCPGTDPSWTPLFLAAGGLIMEVGGMMTHGAVVAREYGLPAVVGVHQATTRLQTGQRVRVNGSTGEITLLKDEEALSGQPSAVS